MSISATDSGSGSSDSAIMHTSHSPIKAKSRQNTPPAPSRAHKQVPRPELPQGKYGLKTNMAKMRRKAHEKAKRLRHQERLEQRRMGGGKVSIGPKKVREPFRNNGDRHKGAMKRFYRHGTVIAGSRR